MISSCNYFSVYAEYFSQLVQPSVRYIDDFTILKALYLIDQPACSKDQDYNETFAIFLWFCAYRNPHVNPPANYTKQNELTSIQDLTRQSNIRSNKALSKAHTSPKAYTLFFIPPHTKNLFTKFMKMIIETMQAQVWDPK